MTLARAILAPILTFLLTGCATPSRWSENDPVALRQTFAASETAKLEIRDSLLELFANEELARVVADALARNPDLLRARARMEEVGYNLRRTRSALYPKLDGSASAGRSVPAGGSETDNFSADLDARWEVDVWGRLRAGVKASAADFAAAQADFEAAEQSLVGQTMQAWFNLIAAEKLLDLDQRRVDSFETTTKLVGRRFDLGEATLSELNLSRTDLENARADLEGTRNFRDQAARRIRALIGEYPDSYYNGPDAWPTLEQTLAPGIPSDLLQARPDVRSAFERVQAADSRVKVAHADIFPSFLLTGNGGRRSVELSDLSDSAFNSWSALADLTLNLFDAGQGRADLGAARKRAEQAYYNYQLVVLNALREAENAIGSELYLAREEAARLAALEAAQRSFDSARRDYESGLTSILSLLETQRRVFNTERQTINLKASRLNNRVSLALALGKGS